MIEQGVEKLNGPGYRMKLPWKSGLSPLEDKTADSLSSLKQGEARLKGILAKLRRSPDDQKDYVAALDQYIKDDYAKLVYSYDPKVPPSDAEDPRRKAGQIFLPHHGVRKRSTNKMRVVFDASATIGKAGLSMNQRLWTGPKLQIEILDVLLRFREYKFAFVADIKAMFSRIRLTPDDAMAHQYLWPAENGKINVYQMQRVTFGTAASPCLAIAITRRAAKDFGQDRPEGKRLIEEQMYVDDAVTSEPTIEGAIEAASQANEILEEADFHLQGFMSNHHKFLQHFNVDMVEEVSVLGMRWMVETDQLLHAKLPVPTTITFTKRCLLSYVAELFSPMGLVSPLVIEAKIHLKFLHLLGLGWDEDITALANNSDKPKAAKAFQKEIDFWEGWLLLREKISEVKFHRCLMPNLAGEIQLHTFGDASEDAFAAVAYLRAKQGDNITIRLIISKTRVAPRKAVSVAKLELNAALLAARLANTVTNTLRIKSHQRFCWTDSSCTRHWVRSNASHFLPYVQNRIGEIQSLTSPEEWRFLPGRINIADAATRADKMTLDNMEDIMEKWQAGPDFLQTENWPKDIAFEPVTEELRPKYLFTALIGDVIKVQPVINWSHFSNFGRLQRGIARIIQLQRKFRQRKEAGRAPIEGADDQAIPVELVDFAFNEMIRLAQQESYIKEITLLKAGKELFKSSSLLPFTPILDNDLLRVGGRIGRFSLPFNVRHPLIIDGRHPLTRIIAEYKHRSNFHPGVGHLLSILRQSIWPTGGRELCKKITSSCRDCHRRRFQPMHQLMADLPLLRFNRTAPFCHTSVDMFGPIKVRMSSVNTRGSKTEERYGAIFTCMVTRAVHLVVTESMSASDFLNSLRAFESIRGRCQLLYSDNGKNFIAAAKQVKIKWIFYTPRAPHFGGVHESLVKSAKRALLTVIEKAHKLLTDIELNVLFCEVTGFLNSRPLTYVSASTDEVITPNSFLSPKAIFEPTLHPEVETASKYRKSYERLQSMTNEVWKLWTNDYLPTLITRNKWRLEQRNPKVGDLVMLVDENLKRGKWKHGFVEEVIIGNRGFARSLRVKVITECDGTIDGKAKSKTYLRPIVKCCLLEPISLPNNNAEDRDEVEMSNESHLESQEGAHEGAMV